ncbi:DNA invertase Pin-like site-specific DNA recombinase [Cytobacillus kochii]|nr:DNA invertase Pin-like site-specific DNA recombinase [Cytobacillus kochii]
MRRDWPQLKELLKVLRSGDKVVVYKLDRISRSILIKRAGIGE